MLHQNFIYEPPDTLGVGANGENIKLYFYLGSIFFIIKVLHLDVCLCVTLSILTLLINYAE